jgi:hypothetical protein
MQRFHDFAICICNSNANCLQVFTVLVVEFGGETLASKTINSRLAQNDELKRDKG